MMKVPGGRFYMGVDEDVTGAKPAHAVTLAPYCIDAFQVTTARYQACSDAGRCKRPARDNDWKGVTARDHRLYDPLCNAREPNARGQHPMNCVSWDMAQSYCSAQGARLPTEAEWELAARGRDGRRYPWGDAEPTARRMNACGKECLAWAKARGIKPEPMFAEDDGWATTAPVGSFPSGDSPFGLHDVVGNVREWTNDFYADYTNSAQTDPTGPATGTERVTRGAAWNATSTEVAHTAFRSHESPDARRYAVGFRCARPLGE
jgi:formylglycine-generating enzyme required for sulfatase activity